MASMTQSLPASGSTSWYAHYADLDATVRVAAGELAGKVGRGELVFNVKDYGAIGNGIADDSAAIQAAVDAAGNAGGGRVLFPAGTYATLAVVELRSNIWLDGHGATITKLGGTYTIFAARVTSIPAGGVTWGSGVRNLRASGLRFVGDFANAKAYSALSFNSLSGALIEDCVFEQTHAGGHILDMGGSENITIRNNTFLGQLATVAAPQPGEAIQIDVSTKGSSFDPGGEYFSGLPCRNVFVDGNQFLPITVAGVTYPCSNPLGTHAQWEGIYHENIWFTNNLVIDPQHMPAPSDEYSSTANGGYKYGTLHFSMIKNLHISGNTFRMNESATRATRVISISGLNYGNLAGGDPNADTRPGGVFTTPSNPEDITITDNTFDGFKNATTPQEMIRFSSGSGRIKNVTIANNVFRNGYNALEISDPLRAAIGLYWVESPNCSNNVFKSLAIGYYVYQCRDLSVTGDSFYSVFSWPLCTDTVTGVNISGCIHDDVGWPMQFTNTSPIVVSGCTFHNARTGAGNKAAIYLAACTDFAIVGCLIKAGAGGINTNAIRYDGSCLRGFAGSNTVIGGTTTYNVFGPNTTAGAPLVAPLTGAVQTNGTPFITQAGNVRIA